MQKVALGFQLHIPPPLLFTNEGIQEATLPSPDNNVLINFLGTLEFLEHSEVRGVQPDAGKLKSAVYEPAANLWRSRCALPPWMGSWWSLYLSKELLNTAGRALMKIENIFCCLCVNKMCNRYKNAF